MRHFQFIAAVALVCLAVVAGVFFLGRTSDTNSAAFLDLSTGKSQSATVQYADKTAATKREAIRFGFDLRLSPEEDTRQYLPFLAYLEKATGYTFKLRFTPEDGKISDDLGKGIIQIAAIGAVSHLKANKKYGIKPLVRGLNAANSASYQSAIVVATDSNIQSLKELRGKRMALGSTNSTQGHIIPRIALKKHGLTLDDLANYEYTGSHWNCANAVITGKADACGMQDTMAKALAAEGKVKILFLSKFYPSSGIAVSNDLADDIVARIQQALIEFDPKGRHAKNLYNWNRTEMPNGFVAASSDDYAELKAKITELGLLD